MKLKIIIDDSAREIDVPQDLLASAEDFFRKMDSDMDRGWRMGPEFIDHPDQTNRCQIAADKLLASISTGNSSLAMLMAGYILKRRPGVTGVRIDTGGEPLGTELIFGSGGSGEPPHAGAASDGKTGSTSMARTDAIARAEKEVTQVYRVGQAYRFAARDPGTGRWIESPLMSSLEEAQQQRMEAFDERFEQLTGCTR
ncbi:MAG: hypothetical protein M0039_02830 [Pseudomonadota bacterium]|nr:hypothetical protein [Pseudomonadota bacterium]